jgi:hypothetical protein
MTKKKDPSKNVDVFGTFIGATGKNNDRGFNDFMNDLKSNSKLRDDFLKAVDAFAAGNGYELKIDDLAKLELTVKQDQPRRRPVDEMPRASTLAMGEEDRDGRMGRGRSDFTNMTDADPEEEGARKSVTTRTPEEMSPKGPKPK